MSARTTALQTSAAQGARANGGHADPALDDLSRLAAMICAVPFAGVSFLDGRWQWFASANGAGVAKQSPREESFCDVAVGTDTMLLVENAADDPRFAKLPLVTGEAGIRFYAGVPLRHPGGGSIGVMCVMDRRPRTLSSEQRDALVALARQVERALELRAIQQSKPAAARGLYDERRERTRTQRLSKVERDLRDALQLQRAIVDGADYALIATTDDGTITAFNPAAERMLGWSSDELVGRATPERLHVKEEVIARAAELSAKLGRLISPGFEVFVAEARLGKADERRWTYVRKDGTHFPVLLSVTALPDDSGGARGFLGIAKDISEQVAAEQSLRLGEAKFRTMLENSPLGIFLTDASGDALYTNPAWGRIGGMTPEASRGRGWIAAIHPMDRERIGREWYAAAQAGGEFRSEHRFLHPDGTVVWTECLAMPYFDQGELLGYVGTVHDITDRHMATEALNESEDRYRSVISALSEGVVLQNQDGVIQACNDSACQILGLTAAQLHGRASLDPDWRAVHEDGSPFPGSDHPAMRSLATGQPYSDVVMGVHLPSGGLRWISVNSRPLVRPGQDRPYAAVASFRDITAKKRAMSELEEAKFAAEAASRAKTSFLANMSHEIRTPMTAILGYAELLEDYSLDLASRSEFLGVIRRNGGHLIEVINDILDITKIEAGSLTMEQIPCRVETIVDEVSSLMRVRAAEKGIAFEVAYRRPLPPMIHSDPTRVRQILFNLVGNAIKFTEQGSVRIDVSVVEGSGHLRFDVADTGIGMTPEQLGQLYKPFAQADASMSRRFGGTGLGLTISRKLAEFLGGDLRVVSSPGAGSTFSFTVPIGSPVEPIAQPSSGPTEAAAVAAIAAGVVPNDSAPPLAPADDAMMGRRILLAEDSADNRRLVSALLKRTGLELQTAVNGRTAVELVTAAVVAGRPFDLILMDMQMPEVDGYEATRQIRALGHKTPIVAFTAHAMKEERGHCIAAGCDDFASKPIDRAALLATLGRFLPRFANSVESNASTNDASATHKTNAGGGVLVSTLCGDPDIQAILPAFVAELPAQIAEIQSLLETGAISRLRSAVHRIKGAAGGYGFEPISVKARDVERAIERASDESLSLARQQAMELIELTRRVQGYDGELERAASRVK
ncbi:PAS domain S-box protein [Humisphaera borealis]|uniref:histidine kinase n=1 Tax=Humisphaera borealis TaxID=2807512 RepID=A0A7M2WX83_9BACT|nr:PAS domain S-box protein [Humisphaera borealis]QOV89120.1 PAS domain S-box protein [Humisphaera borealis]